ncbi:uncharacterized protein PRCAT00000532001 [Priceomyces carsonii]|uniref:uncharacterized protein n=1 Tax=Priceomyces carsonii TaxID=28549 RepID=UPI002EDA18B2|nr:unnamed protein product [Priceomyces carsonii]
MNLLDRILTYTILICIHVFGCRAFDANRNVLELNDSNIPQILASARYSFIYFYTDGCKFCSEFEPTFQYLSLLYNNGTELNDKKLQIIKTNGRLNKRLQSLFKVDKFPTLKMLNFKTKEILTFEAKDRAPDTLIEFVQNIVPDVTPNYDNFVTDVLYLHDSNFDQEIKNRHVLVVFTMKYLDEWSDYEYPYHFYQALASSMSGLKTSFALVAASEPSGFKMVRDYGITNFPSMIYFSPDGSFKTYRINPQNHHIKNKLVLSDIESFLNGTEGSRWYKSITELDEDREESLLSEDISVLVPGFNFNGFGKILLGDIEQDYAYLLNEIHI